MWRLKAQMDEKSTRKLHHVLITRSEKNWTPGRTIQVSFV